ncbi:PilZ domain-containing protein [Desulfobulbus sp.]|uniref:PilZ domain-containing protein n=1 Tax=Desulfobulbus sp. TaxID=895 RepID=UPI00286F42A3|nr:PilZ domain-containing protein [Desulfobulbus sp.]
MAKGQKPVKTTANIKKNRLYLTIAGNIDAKMMQKLYTDIRFCVADLKKGFDVVSDVSQCNILYVTGLPIYKKIIDFLIANHVGSIVRIISDDNLSYKQLANFSARIHSYRTLYAHSLEEAEQKLEELAKRDGIRFSFNFMQIQCEWNGRADVGQLIDISISGCAVQAQAEAPAVGEEIGIRLEFTPRNDQPAEPFELRGKVVRSGEDGKFAAQFIDLEEERKAQLYEHLAYEVTRIPFEPPQ